MKSLILRVVLVAMVAFTMLGAAPKAKPIFGTFNFQDVAAGGSSISQPAGGVCYKVASHALSSKNETDAPAFIFKDPHCNVGKEMVGPANYSPSNFGSVMFQK